VLLVPGIGADAEDPRIALFTACGEGSGVGPMTRLLGRRHEAEAVWKSAGIPGIFASMTKKPESAKKAKKLRKPLLRSSVEVRAVADANFWRYELTPIDGGPPLEISESRFNSAERA
jgi:hypothetical protein